MRLEIGKYIIENDSNYSIVLRSIEKTDKKKANTKHDERIVTVGYFSNLEQVFNRMLNLELAQSEVKTVNELLYKYRELQNQLKHMKDYTVKSINNVIQSKETT